MENKESSSPRKLWNRFRDSARSCRSKLGDVKSSRYRAVASFHGRDSAPM